MRSKRTVAFIAALLLLTPLLALAVRKDTERTPLPLVTPQSYTTEFEEFENEGIAALSATIYASAVDVGDEQLQESEVPKAAAPVRYAITDYERDQIERMVASEGGYCPYEFQALVAECILNGAEKDDLRPLELFARGDYWITLDLEPTETTKQAVSDVFDKGVLPTDEKIFCYYNPNYCDSAVHEAQRYVLTCCDCRFFRGVGMSKDRISPNCHPPITRLSQNYGMIKVFKKSSKIPMPELAPR